MDGFLKEDLEDLTPAGRRALGEDEHDEDEESEDEADSFESLGLSWADFK